VFYVLDDPIQVTISVTLLVRACVCSSNVTVNTSSVPFKSKSKSLARVMLKHVLFLLPKLTLTN